MNAHAPVVLDIAGTTLSRDDRRRLKHPLTGGLILFARHWVDRRQLIELTSALKRERPDLLICVDHEGGRVQRFKSDGFTHLAPMRVLGEHELAVYRARSARVAQRGISYLATRFSAKEAFSKAIGMGMRMPMTWRDCEVVKAPSGKPEIRLHGALAQWFESRGLRAHVSVSDETDFAASFVVVETRENL